MTLFSNTLKHSSIGLAALGLALGIGSVSAEGTLNVTNRAKYIGEETIANFEKEFDVKVTYDNQNSVEAIDSRLLVGSTGYDVVSDFSTNVARLIPAGILQPLDKSKLSNLVNICIDILDQLAAAKDPGNVHLIPQGFCQKLSYTATLTLIS